MNFYYDEEAIRCLKAKDPILADVIDRIGPIERPIDADLFSALVNNIVGQQISMKAQETVWKRMLAVFGAITPDRICRASIEEYSSVVYRPVKQPISVRLPRKSFPVPVIWRR